MISPTLQLKGVSWGSPSRWIFKQTSLRVQPRSSNCEHLHTEGHEGHRKTRSLGNFIMRSINVAVTVPHLTVQPSGFKLPHSWENWFTNWCPSSSTTGETLVTAETRTINNNWVDVEHLYNQQALGCYLHDEWMLISLRGWTFLLQEHFIINLSYCLLYKAFKGEFSKLL